MATRNKSFYNEEQPQQQEEAEPKRLDARPKNNLYAAGTGTAIRVGTRNRDGSTSPVSSTFGTATGPLSQPPPRLNPSAAEPSGRQQEAQAGDDGSGNGGFGSRPGRLDARPRNNLYAEGTGPGTGRTAVRTGTRNRDGSISPVSALGAATGPLSQPLPKFFTPRATPASAYAQRQGNVANAKANGTFDATRAKFNAANSGQSMDEAGNISKNPNATKFDQVPDGLGGYKMVPVPQKKTPAAPAAAPSAAATAGHPDTIKAETKQFGSNPGQGMQMTKSPVPAVIGASPLQLPSASSGSSVPSIFTAPSAGIFQASTQPLGVAGLGQMPPLRLAGALARGGPVQAGRPYLVGEEGPEIVVPTESGTVVPNHEIEFPLRDEGGTDEEASAGGPTIHEPKVLEPAAAAAGAGENRPTSGLFMRPRPMPPEFARQWQQQSGGSDSGYTRTTSETALDANTPPETQRGDETEGLQPGLPQRSRPPETGLEARTLPVGRLFEKRLPPGWGRSDVPGIMQQPGGKSQSTGPSKSLSNILKDPNKTTNPPPPSSPIRSDARFLTEGEKQLVKSIFGDSITDLDKVEIRNRQYFPFQPSGTTVTPNGNLYPGKDFRSVKDFSKELPHLQAHLIHEMTHVWQHQNGMSVLLRGLGSGIAKYDYVLEPGKLFNKYSMEQQASIVEDYLKSLQGEKFTPKYRGKGMRTVHPPALYEALIPWLRSRQKKAPKKPATPTPLP